MRPQQLSCKCKCLQTNTEEQEVGYSQNRCFLTDLPKDLLGHILSRTTVDNVIRSSSVCRDWELYITSKSFNKVWIKSCGFQGPPWLFALSTYNCRDCCCAYNPILNKWYSIPLLFLPKSLRIPVAANGGFVLVKGSSIGGFQHFAVCNPISKQWRNLPSLHKPRSSSLISLIERGLNPDDNNGGGFQIIVAGGRSQDANGYEPSIELYDSMADSWNVVGEVPCEYAVRLALWTPNDTVYCNGTIYCLTSARPYSIIAFDFVNGVWSEVMVPRAPYLLCSFLVQRRERLTLVGGVGSPRNCKCLKVWELDKEDEWVEIESMPGEFFSWFLGGNADFDYKFAGCGDFLYFFKDSQSQILVCELSSHGNKTSWRWIPGCSSVGLQFSKCSIRGMFIQPRLDVSGLY